MTKLQVIDGPVWVHDCNVCTYLGSAIDEDGETKVDLYHHNKDLMGPTVIVRCSSIVSHYRSGIVFANVDPAINHAKELAAARGLDVSF